MSTDRNATASGSTGKAEAPGTPNCSSCDCSIECCAFCDETECGVAICYGCMIVEIGQTAPEIHDHGG